MNEKGMIFIDGSNVFMIGKSHVGENNWIFKNTLSL